LTSRIYRYILFIQVILSLMGRGVVKVNNNSVLNDIGVSYGNANDH